LNKEENEHLHAHVALSANQKLEVRMQIQEDKKQHVISYEPNSNDHRMIYQN
jgi:hypothetical protein